MMDHHAALVANRLGVRPVRLTGDLLMALEPTFTYADGVPAEIGPVGLRMDAQRIGIRGASRGQDDPELEAAFFASLGPISSAYEHGLFELTMGAVSASTVRVMRAAMEEGIPIVGIGPHNAVLADGIDAAPNVRDNVRAWAQAGLTVYVPEREVTINRWTGQGWIVQDFETGFFAYLLAGSLGGATTGSSDAIDAVADFVDKAYSTAKDIYTAQAAAAVAASAPTGPGAVAVGVAEVTGGVALAYAMDEGIEQISDWVGNQVANRHRDRRAA
jgi:hypothetical protein